MTPAPESQKKDEPARWTTPAVTELAMNAEIGSYQEDPGSGGPDWARPDDSQPGT